MGSKDSSIVERLKNMFLSEYRRVSERDKKWIMQIEVHLLDKPLYPLFAIFLCLNSLDVYTTLLALHISSLVVELNPIAAVFFNHGFIGFLSAMALKYSPTVPMLYVVFTKDSLDRHPLRIRIIKLGGLVALAASDFIYFCIVMVNNIPLLIRLTIV